ncbi:hypothetical protein ASE89_11660 [Sphingomonas sp. Leaf30]|nr:hypothetical protein ASE89_11660 [Sphingomonas sp. Leaf30]
METAADSGGRPEPILFGGNHGRVRHALATGRGSFAGGAQCLRTLGAAGHVIPGLFGAAAAVADVVERGGIAVATLFFSAGPVEFWIIGHAAALLRN